VLVIGDLTGGQDTAFEFINSLADARRPTTTTDGTSGLYLWGAQTEAAAFPTSTIISGASTVTRAADSASVVLGPWFSTTEGTLVVEAQIARASTTFAQLARFRNAGGTSYVEAYYRGNGFLGAGVVDATVTQANLTPGAAPAANAIVKLAFAWRANDFAACANGSAVVTDTSGTLPVDLSTLYLGGAQSPLNGWLRKFDYERTRLPDATLQARTA
jgi:hypothetical protein